MNYSSKNANINFFEQLTNGKLVAFQKKIATLFPVNKKESSGYFNLIVNTSSLMLSQIAKLTLQIDPPDVLIEISRYSCGVFDFYKATELIEFGKQATIDSLKKLTIKNR